MTSYHAILVLGSQPDPATWQFPAHTYASLDKALALYEQGVAPYIVLSGDHALRFDNTGITQPFTEADKMQEYLLAQGCPPAAINTEDRSRDTLANYYHLKNLIFIPRGWTRILQVTTGFRVPRLEFLSRKVLGAGYTIDFANVPFDAAALEQHEAFIFMKQREFLQDMADGDDAYLRDQFYDSPMYRFWRQREQAEAGESTQAAPETTA